MRLRETTSLKLVTEIGTSIIIPACDAISVGAFIMGCAEIESYKTITPNTTSKIRFMMFPIKEYRHVILNDSILFFSFISQVILFSGYRGKCHNFK